MAGAGRVTVVVPGGQGGTSAEVPLRILNPAPVLAELTPRWAPATGDAFQLTLSGANFVAGATLMWNGSPRPAAVQSATRAVVGVTAADLRTRDTVRITLSNPPPAAGTSRAVNLPILLVAPSLSHLVPDQARAGSAGMTVAVHGKDSTRSTVVLWASPGASEWITPVFVTTELLQVCVRPALLVAAGTVTVTADTRLNRVQALSQPVSFRVVP